jgi:hypothetical protein
MTKRNITCTATWLEPAHALHDFATAAFLSLLPLLFMRAPAAVWVGTIIELVNEFHRRAG